MLRNQVLAVLLGHGKSRQHHCFGDLDRPSDFLADRDHRDCRMGVYRGLGRLSRWTSRHVPSG